MTRLHRVSDRVYLVFTAGQEPPIGTLWWGRGVWHAEYGSPISKRKRFQYRADAKAWLTKQFEAEPIRMPGLVAQP